MPAAGTAQRAVEQLREFVGEDVPVTRRAEPATPVPGSIAVVRGRLADGFVSAAGALVVLTEADLTG